MAGNKRKLENETSKFPGSMKNSKRSLMRYGLIIDCWLSAVRFNYKPVYKPCDLLKSLFYK